MCEHTVIWLGGSEKHVSIYGINNIAVNFITVSVTVRGKTRNVYRRGNPFHTSGLKLWKFCLAESIMYVCVCNFTRNKKRIARPYAHKVQNIHGKLAS